MIDLDSCKKKDLAVKSSFSVYLRKDLAQRFHAFVEDHRLCRSAVVSALIERFLDEEKERSDGQGSPKGQGV